MIRNETTAGCSPCLNPHKFIHTVLKDAPSVRLWECHRGGLDLGQIRLEAIKQASNRVSSQNARRNSHARRHHDTNLCSCTLRGGGIGCHVQFSQCSRRWGMSPLSNLLHTQQVLTSRLSSACCESNSSGRRCLIRMRTDSSCPIPVF